jgi:broad specificity phosphatase PhoE
MEASLIDSSRSFSVKSPIKSIHFVRHAEGVHNVAGRTIPKGYLLQENEDAWLTHHGIEQCKMLHSQLCSDAEHAVSGAQLLLVSPLKRTLQTATLSFPHLIHRFPWLALECIREQMGLHPCDRRKPISHHQPNFSHVDFALIGEDEDTLWPRYPSEREPDLHVVQRAEAFVNWLRDREETSIIVVTHSAFLRHFFTGFLRLPMETFEHFENCELRSYIFEFKIDSTLSVTPYSRGGDDA